MVFSAAMHDARGRCRGSSAVAPALAVLFLLTAGSAHAQVSNGEAFRPTHAFHTDLGLFSALGEVGGDFQYQFAPHFLLEVGVGYGISGFQLSLMPKLVFGSASDRFVTGVGVSLAVPGVTIVTNNGPSGGNQDERVLTPWVNIDALGYEHRSSGGFSFTVAGGIGLGFVHGCVNGIDGCANLDGQPFPQLRFGFGPWFF